MKFTEKLPTIYRLKSLDESKGYRDLSKHWSQNYDYFNHHYMNIFPESKTCVPVRKIIEESIDKLFSGELKNIRWRDMS